MNVVSVIGARPQVVKSAVVSRALRAAPGIKERVLHTGQHYDHEMSDIFFTEFGMRPPEFHLGVGSGSHAQQTAAMLEGIERVLVQDRPDWVLVYGDTNSTIAGGLAAAKLQIPVAHVEAGLRSFNRRMAEEINRIVTDHLATLCFAPTEGARGHLLAEGISEMNIALVGDVMYDVALTFGDQAEKGSRILSEQRLEQCKFVLATVHRAENTDTPERLTAILEGLSLVGRRMPVILPLHPRTAKSIASDKALCDLTNGIRVIPPVGYLDMVMLERHAALIATDSGGVQKEAFFHRVPCVTLRDETEWTELLDLGWNHLVPPTSGRVIASAILARIGTIGRDGYPYGDGNASKAIAMALLEFQAIETGPLP